MEVYILMCNRYCMHEYDDHEIVDVFLNKSKAEDALAIANTSKLLDHNIYSGTSYYISTYAVKD